MRYVTRKPHWLGPFAGLVLAGGCVLQAQTLFLPPYPNVMTAGPPARVRAVESLGDRPLVFEANRGQTDERARFVARAPGQSVFLTTTEAVLAFSDDPAAPSVRLRWGEANPAPRIYGERPLPGKTHVFRGADPTRWTAGIPTYGQVRYEKVWPGIDLVFYGNGRQLEHDFQVAPGADPRMARLFVEGADRLEIDPAGDLVIGLASREVRLRKPLAYQEIDGVRRQVACGYRLLPGAKARVGFNVGAYDRRKPLVIDPVLVYSSYFGGSRYERGSAIAVDGQGRAYVAGYTNSPDFPGAPVPTFSDVLLLRLSPRGEVLDTLLLGGWNGEEAMDIALDGAGAVYLTGHTNSYDFPLVNPLPSSYIGRPGAGQSAFVMKLDLDGPTGPAILYSTQLGGLDWDMGMGIAVDSKGQAHIYGHTASADFPRVNALPLGTTPPTFNNIGGFVAKLSASGSQLIYSTYLGDAGTYPTGIAIDAGGYAWVAGTTPSPDFPTTGTSRDTLLGSWDGFLSKLSLEGSPLLYSTYLGGIDSDGDGVWAIASDRSGSIYVAGYTTSPDFPRGAALQPEVIPGPRPPEYDIFLMKLTSTGETVYSTYVPGVLIPSDLAADAAGSVYVAGFTEYASFPLVKPVQSRCLPTRNHGLCGGDAFVLQVDPTGRNILFSTFLGGAVPIEPGYLPDDVATDVAVDARRNIYLTGIIRSRDFPTVNAVQTSLGGGTEDFFVARIAPDNRPPDCSGAAASPGTVWPPNGRLATVSVLGVTDPEDEPVTIAVIAIRQDEPLSRSGFPDGAGTGTPAAQVRADRDGGGDGRVYRITFEARDPLGASCTAMVTVCVPHDQRLGAVCGDGGGLVDSIRP